MNHLIKEIHGLDPIGWFPLAIGWYLAFLVGLLCLLFLFRLTTFRREYPTGTWHKEAYLQLKALKREAKAIGGIATVNRLSELLRRVAMARCGRQNCASLSGQAWLQWLEENDPKGFLWSEKGVILLTLPYSGQQESSHIPLMPLIDATLVWTNKKYEHCHV